MSIRTLKVLHVEDEESQRRLLVHHLRGMDDYQFEVQHVDSEDAALSAFQADGADLVILDYHLRQGNGLHCLEVLRQYDPVVPIIAVSGVASEEIAAELVQCGADDYISKRELTGAVMARAIRDSIGRADAWRQRNAWRQM